MSFNDLYPADLQSATSQEDDSGNVVAMNFQICGKDVPRGYWVGLIIYLLFCSVLWWSISFLSIVWFCKGVFLFLGEISLPMNMLIICLKRLPLIIMTFLVKLFELSYCFTYFMFTFCVIDILFSGLQ